MAYMYDSILVANVSSVVEHCLSAASDPTKHACHVISRYNAVPLSKRRLNFYCHFPFQLLDTVIMASDCCFRGFLWGQEPKGREITFACGNKSYITSRDNSGSSGYAEAAIMLIHDLFGWTFRNTRILADALAKEVGATVYVPDL